MPGPWPGVLHAVSLRCREPSVRMVEMPSRSSNASIVPSGDHATTPAATAAIVRKPVPSGRIAAIPSARANAISEPSGDQRGERSAQDSPSQRVSGRTAPVRAS